VQSPDLKNLDTKRLEPGEQPVQRSLIPQRAMHDCLHGSTDAVSLSKSSRTSGGRVPATRIS